MSVRRFATPTVMKLEEESKSRKLRDPFKWRLRLSSFVRSALYHYSSPRNGFKFNHEAFSKFRICSARTIQHYSTNSKVFLSWVMVGASTQNRCSMWISSAMKLHYKHVVPLFSWWQASVSDAGCVAFSASSKISPDLTDTSSQSTAPSVYNTKCFLLFISFFFGVEYPQKMWIL